MAAPGNKADFNLSEDAINLRAQKLIDRAKTVYESIGNLSPSEVTYENFIKPLADIKQVYTSERSVLKFLQHVSPDIKVKKASYLADRQLIDFELELNMRSDIFKNLIAAEENIGNTLKPEAKRFVIFLIKQGKRNGIHLPLTTQEELKAMQKQINDLSFAFMGNLKNKINFLEFTAEELAGLPENYIKGLTKTGDGKCRIPVTVLHYLSVVKFAKSPQTRRIFETAFNCRTMKENTSILEKLIEVRHKRAQLLGYTTHAHYTLEMKMAKNPETVEKFLDQLVEKLQPLKEQELSLFRKFKLKELHSKAGTNPDDVAIEMSDMRYYMTKNEEKRYAIDHFKLKEYFPIDVVTKGIMEIFQELLSLKFQRIENAEVWDKEVTMYSVRDKESEELLGYFYLDLFPRNGKGGHAAVYTVQPGVLCTDGSRQVAVSSLSCSFPAPTAYEPCLLMHNELCTYFHEFGHVMHHICAKAEFSIFTGSQVEKDFLEAPSQMLENWVWEEGPLRRLSAHYKDGSAIPDKMLDSLIKSRTANSGLLTLRQIFLAKLDQTLHARNKVDSAAIAAELSQKLLGIPLPPNTNFAASFGHLASSYDSQYYGYLWSEVFSADMFQARFKKEGIMNPEVGMDYRKYILEPGGTMDAEEMLRNFLGRDPKPQAFLINKGLEKSDANASLPQYLLNIYDTFAS